MPAAYSKRSLPEKLGIKPGFRFCILNAPASYDATLGELASGCSTACETKGALDFIQFFAKQRSELERFFPVLKKELAETGMLWIS